jgi:cytochrome c oxidase cbb3-type subunit 3
VTVRSALFALCASLAHAVAAQQPQPPASIGYPQHVFAGGVAPVSGALEHPVEPLAQLAKQGERYFSAFNCDGCHAGGAVGAVGPSLADGRWRYGGAEDELFMTIFYGRPRGMPGFGGFLPATVIWSLVAYLRSLEPAHDVATVRWDH